MENHNGHSNVHTKFHTANFPSSLLLPYFSSESVGAIRRSSVFAADAWHRLDEFEVAAEAGGQNKTSVVVKVSHFYFPLI